LLAATRWQQVVVLVADRWDGQTVERREDVVAYYAAGVLVAQGHGDALYQVEAVTGIEEDILGRPAGQHGGLAYLNPPFVAALFQPLAYLAYGRAQAIWFALSVLALLAAILLLQPELRRLPSSWAAALVLGALAAFPVFWSLLYGQSSSLILLSWALFYRLLKAGRDGPAGMVLAVALIKPHLALVPVLYLLAMGRWRALFAFGAGTVALAGASVALAGAEVTFVSYPKFLMASVGWENEYGVDRAHMYGWTAFFSTSLPEDGRTVALTLGAVASALTLLAATCVWRSHRSLDDAAQPMLALAIASILISPHIHAQDLQILLLPLLIASRRDLLYSGPLLVFLLIPVSSVISVNATTAGLATCLAIAAAQGLRPTAGQRARSPRPDPRGPPRASSAARRPGTPARTRTRLA
jgi:hypothetical protein